MVDEKVPLEGCPREGCDDPIIEAIRTDQPFQIRKQNMVADKWCLIPRVDPASGDYFVYAIRHGEVKGFKTGQEVAEEEAEAAGDIDGALEAADADPEELAEELEEQAEAAKEEGREQVKEAAGEATEGLVDEVTTEEADAPEASADPNEDAPEASPGADSTDLEGFERAIVEHVKAEGPGVTRAGIQGAMLDRDKSPNEVKAACEWLVENGYLIEHERGAYKLPE